MLRCQTTIDNMILLSTGCLHPTQPKCCPLYFQCVLWGGNSRVWTWYLNWGTGSCISFWQFIFQNSYILIPGLGEGQHEQLKVNSLENHNKTSQHGNQIEKLYHWFWVHRGQRASSEFHFTVNLASDMSCQNQIHELASEAISDYAFTHVDISKLYSYKFS